MQNPVSDSFTFKNPILDFHPKVLVSNIWLIFGLLICFLTQVTTFRRLDYFKIIGYHFFLPQFTLDITESGNYCKMVLSSVVHVLACKMHLISGLVLFSITIIVYYRIS